jgi:hypothetical protein
MWNPDRCCPVFLVEPATDSDVIALDFAWRGGAGDAGDKPGRWPKRVSVGI